MTRRRAADLAMLAAAIMLLSTCEAPPNPNAEMVRMERWTLRTVSSRTFDATDQIEIGRAVIAALQDLGFVIVHTNRDGALNPGSGVLLAARFENGTGLWIEAGIDPAETGGYAVGLGATYEGVIQDQAFYDRLFAAIVEELEKGDRRPLSSRL